MFKHKTQRFVLFVLLLLAALLIVPSVAAEDSADPLPVVVLAQDADGDPVAVDIQPILDAMSEDESEVTPGTVLAFIMVVGSMVIAGYAVYKSTNGDPKATSDQMRRDEKFLERLDVIIDKVHEGISPQQLPVIFSIFDKLAVGADMVGDWSEYVKRRFNPNQPGTMELEVALPPGVTEAQVVEVWNKYQDALVAEINGLVPHGTGAEPAG